MNDPDTQAQQPIPVHPDPVGLPGPDGGRVFPVIDRDFAPYRRASRRPEGQCPTCGAPYDHDANDHRRPHLWPVTDDDYNLAGYDPPAAATAATRYIPPTDHDRFRVDL